LKTIIAGSRTITDPFILIDALDKCWWEPSIVLCGMAQGADMLGRQWAKDCDIPVIEYPALWRIADTYDNFAGLKRNIEMAKNANALIALWDGHSHGTAHMINTAKKHNLVVHVEMV
jgi:YspA, cpYpsA-related SLOG family